MYPKTLTDLGRVCKRLRLSKGYTQADVGRELCTSSQNVSHFETGINDSAYLLLWYLDHGLDTFIREESKHGL